MAIVRCPSTMGASPPPLLAADLMKMLFDTDKLPAPSQFASKQRSQADRPMGTAGARVRGHCCIERSRERHAANPAVRRHSTSRSASPLCPLRRPDGAGWGSAQAAGRKICCAGLTRWLNATVPFVVIARLAAALFPRAGVRPLVLAGSGCFLAGFGWLAQADADSGYVTSVLGPTLLIAIGIGLTFPTLLAAATADVPQGDAGIIGGLANTASQVGGSVGLAVLATAASARAATEADGSSRPPPSPPATTWSSSWRPGSAWPSRWSACCCRGTGAADRRRPRILTRRTLVRA